MIDPKRAARELARELCTGLVGSEEDRAAVEDEMAKTIEARIRAEYQCHIENIELVTGKKAGA